MGMALGAIVGTMVGLAAKTAGCCVAFLLGRALTSRQVAHVGVIKQPAADIATTEPVAPAAASAAGGTARLLGALRRVVARSPWRGSLLVLSSPLPASIKVYWLSAMPAVSLHTFATAVTVTGAPYTLLLALLGSSLGDTAGEVRPAGSAVIRLSLTALAAASTVASATAAAAALRHELATDAAGGDASGAQQTAPSRGAEVEPPPRSAA